MPKTGWRKPFCKYGHDLSGDNLYEGVGPSGRRWARCRICTLESVKNRQAHRPVKAWLNKVKLEQGCADCGYNEHPAALQFDHLPGNPKNFNIGQTGTRSLQSLITEMSYCEVVCANCHAVRTFNRRAVERREEVMPMNTPKTLVRNGR